MYPVRLILAGCNAAGLCTIRRPLQMRFGRTAGTFFTLLTCSQFHLMFWMGRTLPNMFALLPGVSLCFTPDNPSPNIPNTLCASVNLALSRLLHRPSSLTQALGLLTFTAIIFRAEVALLLAPLAIVGLYKRQIRMTDIFRISLLYGVPSLGPSFFPSFLYQTDDAIIHSFYCYDRFLLLETVASLARVAWYLVQCHPGQELGVGRT